MPRDHPMLVNPETLIRAAERGQEVEFGHFHLFSSDPERRAVEEKYDQAGEALECLRGIAGARARTVALAEKFGCWTRFQFQYLPDLITERGRDLAELSKEPEDDEVRNQLYDEISQARFVRWLLFLDQSCLIPRGWSVEEVEAGTWQVIQRGEVGAPKGYFSQLVEDLYDYMNPRYQRVSDLVNPPPGPLREEMGALLRACGFDTDRTDSGSDGRLDATIRNHIRLTRKGKRQPKGEDEPSLAYSPPPVPKWRREDWRGLADLPDVTEGNLGPVGPPGVPFNLKRIETAQETGTE